MLTHQDQAHTAIRKGTKSCAECRRRKVRCVRIPDDAQICRQCQERGSACLAQTAHPRPRQAQRLPSRVRIAQLEAQVTHLTRVVNKIEVKLGDRPSASASIPEEDSTITHDHDLDSDEDDSDGQSSAGASDIVAAEEPSHLRSLFQNDWLSVDTHRQDEHARERRAKAVAHLLEAARPELQKLIPTREEIRDVSSGRYDWISMLQVILPQPFAARSHREMLESYGEMCKPDVDVISLATWLLEVAITALQVPQGPDSPETEFRRSQRRLGFSRAVSDTTEQTIITHDRLLGTLQGLGMAVHFIRLQIGHGNFQKAWVRLRHVIAIAELMGLPKTVQLFRLKRIGGSGHDETLCLKAQLWEVICNVDRLLGMMINLPPDTRKYPYTRSLDLVVDELVRPSVYFSELTEIAAKLHELEYMNATLEPATKLYKIALDITRETRELASRTPASWWIHDPMDDLAADHMVQLMHYCVIMRAYLPLALRQDRGEEFLYSRLACMDACESVAQRYHFIRGKLPPGMFTSRVLDLQAFTATVVLLLTSHSWPSMDQHSIRIDKARLEGVVSKILDLMRERSKDKAGSDFVERGVSTISALNELLKQDDDVARTQELTLNVPLLGKVHVRRNLQKPQAPVANRQQPSSSSAGGLLSDSQPWKLQEQAIPPLHPQEGPSLHTSAYMRDPMQAGPEWQWNNLSWVIEEDTDPNLFEGLTPLEGFDQSSLWQNSYYVPF